MMKHWFNKRKQWVGWFMYVCVCDFLFIINSIFKTIIFCAHNTPKQLWTHFHWCCGWFYTKISHGHSFQSFYIQKIGLMPLSLYLSLSRCISYHSSSCIPLINSRIIDSLKWKEVKVTKSLSRAAQCVSTQEAFRFNIDCRSLVFWAHSGLSTQSMKSNGGKID